MESSVKKILPYLMLAFALVMILGACGETASETAAVSGYVIDGTNILNYQVVRSDYAEGDGPNLLPSCFSYRERQGMK